MAATPTSCAGEAPRAVSAGRTAASLMTKGARIVDAAVLADPSTVANAASEDAADPVSTVTSTSVVSTSAFAESTTSEAGTPSAAAASVAHWSLP